MQSNTLNVSLPRAQLEWVRQLEEAGAFGSMSAVLQDIIRQAQQAEAQQLQREFRDLQGDGAPGPEPVEAVVAVCRKVKRGRLAQRRS